MGESENQKSKEQRTHSYQTRNKRNISPTKDFKQTGQLYINRITTNDLLQVCSDFDEHWMYPTW